MDGVRATAEVPAAPARTRFVYPVGSPRLTAVTVAGLFLYLVVYLGARLLGPADGTQVLIDPGEPTHGGLLIRAVGPDAPSLQPNDRVIAIDGVPLRQWIAAGGFGGQDPATTAGAHRFTVVRHNGLVEVDVQVGQRDLLATALRDWPIYLFILYFAVVGLLVFARRPELPAARLFARLGVATYVSETTFIMSVPAIQMHSAPLLALVLIGNTVLFFYSLSAAIHFALLFPKPQPILVLHPGRTLLGVYGLPWVLYAGLMLVDRTAFSDPVTLFLRHWQVTSFVGGACFATILLAFVMAFRRIETALERRQLRWIVWGIGIAVVPWIGALLASLVTPLPVRDILIVLSVSWAAIPTTFAIAIVKERMFDIDLLLNRTLVYIVLSAVLAGVYAATVALAQRTFVALTGAGSDGAIVLATLVIVVVFAPIRDASQRLVDRRFKGLPPHAIALRDFGDQVARRLSPVDPQTVARRLLGLGLTALDASGARIRVLGFDGHPIELAEGTPPGDGALELRIHSTTGEPIGLYELGPKTSGRPYERSERELCAEVCVILGDAIVADRPVTGVRRRGAVRPAS